MIDLISGEILMRFSTLQSNPHIKSGKLRVLAVTNLKRTKFVKRIRLQAGRRRTKR